VRIIGTVFADSDLPFWFLKVKCESEAISENKMFLEESHSACVFSLMRF
jgi:hypothetical protein